MHSEKQRLEKAQILAEESLKLAELCRTDADDELKAYQLSQVEALPRDVTADTISYDDDQESKAFK